LGSRFFIFIMSITLEQLEAWDRQHVWHPFTPMKEYQESPPTIIVGGEGFELIDQHGKRYLDGFASMWCNVHGHRVPELDGAIEEQITKISHSTLLGLANETSIELAKRLVEVAPDGLTRVFYSDSGATAVEVALKMAFQYFHQRINPKPNKTKFLAFHGAYHGDTLGDVSVGDIGRFHDLFRPLLFQTIRAPQPYCYRCPLNLIRASCQEACVTEVERMIELHAHELVAVIIEPMMQAAGGFIPFPEGMYRRLREVTSKHDVLLIADEVAVGFGRVGTLFASEIEGVTPDLLCLAKGITGGYLPLAATLATEEIFSAFVAPASQGKSFFHGHTYTGNPIAAAVAIASLKRIQAKQILVDLPDRIEQISRRIAVLESHPNVGEIRQLGLMVGIEIVADRSTKQPFPREAMIGQKVCLLAKELGIMIRPLRDIITFIPAIAVDEATLDHMLDRLIQAILDSLPLNVESA
jgi:adenosylmethionine---8-amino-7-oxononanoate aminotransferase